MESIFIKKRLAAFAVLLGLGAGGVPVFAQQTDPALTAAVVAQTAELKSIHKKRRKLQERIIAAEAAVTVALDRVHSVEDKMLEYLSNAQGAMQNLYQIKRAGELVTTEIPKNCSLLTKSVGGNLKGTAIAAIVYQEFPGEAISEQDKAFTKEFTNFVNGRMCSAEKTGKELTRAHRYLQQQMFKVFMGFIRQLAYNYQKGFYDERNEWASRLASEAYRHLIESNIIFDPNYQLKEKYHE